ncbi:MAG: outer membrane protein assembly factor BamE [Microvirgula sp.]
MFKTKLAPLASVLLLSACSLQSLPGFLQPHTIDIQQGNVVTQDEIDKLRVGMTRSQVRFVLGTPMLADMFHANRWDYQFQLRRAGKLEEAKHFSVIFENDLLARWEGDGFPPRRPQVIDAVAIPAATDGAAPATKPAADSAQDTAK